MYHYAGNNPVRYIDPDGRENDFTFDEKQFIMESQNRAINNLDSLILQVQNYNKNNSKLRDDVSDYLGLDIDNDKDKNYLIDALSSIRDNLNSMTINDYKKSTIPMQSYVTKRTTRDPVTGLETVEYLKTIYLNVFVVSKDFQNNITQPLHAQLIHETSHKALFTNDIGYAIDKNLVKDIPQKSKRFNADNWSMFYLKTFGR